MFLCRSDKFSDPYEGSIPKKEVQNRILEQKRIRASYNQTITDEEAKISSETTAEYHKKLRKSFVVNCWHINTTESDAMWQLYLKTNEGVAIQITYQKLFDSLNHNADNIYLSKIRYINYETDIWYQEKDYPVYDYTVFQAIIHKRIAFQHESELRVFQEIDAATLKDTYWDTQPNSNGINISTNLKILIDKIILPPTAGEDVEKKVNHILKKYDCNFDVIPSTLNDPPVY